MEQLSGQDASFLYFETPRSHMHVASMALYDQSTAPRKLVRFRDITENIRKRLHLAFESRASLITSQSEDQFFSVLTLPNDTNADN